MQIKKRQTSDLSGNAGLGEANLRLLPVHREERCIEEVVLNELAKAAWSAMQTHGPPPVILCHHVCA